MCAPKKLSPQNRLFIINHIDGLSIQSSAKISTPDRGFGMSFPRQRRDQPLMFSVFSGLPASELWEVDQPDTTAFDLSSPTYAETTVYILNESRRNHVFIK